MTDHRLRHLLADSLLGEPVFVAEFDAAARGESEDRR